MKCHWLCRVHMGQYVCQICVYLVPECSEYYREQCKDLKQQMHTEHTNYIADFQLLHNGPVNLQTGARCNIAHLSVVVTGQLKCDGTRAEIRISSFSETDKSI